MASNKLNENFLYLLIQNLSNMWKIENLPSRKNNSQEIDFFKFW